MFQGRPNLTDTWELMTFRRAKQKGYDESTIKKYMVTLQRFTEFLEKQAEFIGKKVIYADQITEDHCTNFMAQYHDNANGYHDAQLGRLNAYFRWLIDEGRLGVNPARNIATRQRGLDDTKHEMKAFTLENMFAVAEDAGHDHISRKYMIILQFFLMRRIGELTKHIHIRDIRLERTARWPVGYSRYYNKKSKRWDEMPLDEQTRTFLLDWLEIYMDLAKAEKLLPEDAKELPEHWLLIPTTKVAGYRVEKGQKRPLLINPEKPVSNPQEILVRSLTRLGLREAYINTHGNRRGGAERLLELTGDIRHVQTALGHKNQRTTERYLGRERQKVALTQAMAKISSGEPVPPVTSEESDHQAIVIPLMRRRSAG